MHILKKYHYTLLIVSLLVGGCGYKGDGNFKASGFWPFINYSLELPEFPMGTSYSTKFSLAGYNSHGQSMMELKVFSSSPVAFYNLDTIVEVKVTDQLGTTYFYRKGPLNQHYMRMSKSGEASWPSETEWNTRYRYGDPEVDNNAVPFKPGIMPNKSRDAKYIHFLPTKDRNLTLYINITNVQEEVESLTGKINLRSGWK